MTKVLRRKPVANVRFLISMGAVLGATLLAVISGSTAAEAAPVVLTYSGTVAAGSPNPSVHTGDAITFKVFADNGGSSLASQSWALTDITGATIQAGTYSASVSGAVDVIFGSNIQTDASGHLITLSFGVGQHGTDSAGLTGEFLFFMGFNDFWYNPLGAGFGATSLPDNSHTTIALVAATPVPATLPLLAAALGGLGFIAWRRKQNDAA